MKIQNNLLIITAMLVAGTVTFNSCSSGEKPAEPQTQSAPLGGGAEEEEEKPASTPAATGADALEWKNNKGIGPVKSVTLGETVDQAMADAGAVIYKEKCTACHKPDKRFIGPAPKGIFERRTPEWVMNMILNPEQMVKEDPIAKQLLIDFNLSPMANQNLTEEEARKVLEYFRTL